MPVPVELAQDSRVQLFRINEKKAGYFAPFEAQGRQDDREEKKAKRRPTLTGRRWGTRLGGSDQSLFSIRISFVGKSSRFSTECGACGGLHCTKGIFGFTLSWRESKRVFPFASRSIVSPPCWI